MNEIKSLYNQNYQSLLGKEVLWLKNIRENLIAEIQKEGLPNKKKEIWKYSDLNNINDVKYNISNSDIEIKDKDNINKIKVINGIYHISEYLKNDKNISLSNLNENIDNFKNYFYFNNEFFKKDFTIDLNTIFLSGGLTISVEENQKIYLIIDYENISNDITNYIRNFIKINQNAELVLVENFNNTNTKNDRFNIFNNFWLEKNAKVEHIIIQNSQPISNLIYSSLIYCYENSKFNQLSFQSGSRSSKFQHSTNLLGLNAIANHYGIYFGKEKQFLDNKTIVTHHAENCQSNQIYKGILTDEANATYLSNTYVNPEAQKTNGYQLSRGILLSEMCKLNTKPELKIYADDVKCSHGSTIGSIDKNQLYYLQSRGIGKKESQDLLIKAFCQDILDIVSEKNLKNNINILIDNWLKNNE